MFEKDKTKKAKQAKGKCNPKETMGAMQKDNQIETREHLLYLRNGGIIRVKLAHRPYVGKGKLWGISEIRFKNFTPTMLQLQYQSGRDGSGLLRKDAKRNRSGGDGKTPKGQASKRKGSRSLSKSNTKIRKDTKRTK